MNPASKLIKKLRQDRNFGLKVAADMLGYEPSFLCAIEGSRKDVPKRFFVDKIISEYKLTHDEQKQLCEAISRSNRKLVIPCKSPDIVYDLIYRMREQLNHLNDKQIDLINIALETK